MGTGEDHPKNANGGRPSGTHPSQDAARAFTHQITLFSVSSAMVGVCLTAISLIMVVENLSQFRTICDGLLVGDSLLFVASTLLSYLAMRVGHPRFSQSFHRAADSTMLIGLIFMALVCILLVFTMI
jgi:hypothetical protein